MNALRILCTSFKIFLEFFMEKKKLLIFLTIIYIFYEVVSKLFLKWSVDTVFCLAMINISKYDLDLEK